MIETAKERIYREALEDLSNSTIDVDKIKKLIENGTISYFYNELDYLDKMSIYAKSALIDAKELADDTDKLSVEKLQEQLNTAKKALTEISEVKNLTPFKKGFETSKAVSKARDMRSTARQALAAIGGDDE